MTKTSWSDRQEYKEAVLSFIKDKRKFKTFRNLNGDFNIVVEHLSYDQGLEYIEHIKQTPDIYKDIKKFKLNDSVGMPTRHSYEGIGNFSPTTLRYIKVLCDLIKLCNFDKNKVYNIIEIGGGYGGQASIIKQYLPNCNYSIVDLEEVTILQKMYLSTLGFNDIKYYTLEDIKNKDFETYDLCISCFALNECFRDTQQIYLDNIVYQSSMGYISGVYTEIGYEEVAKPIKNVSITDYEPNTGHDCKIISWNNL